MVVYNHYTILDCIKLKYDKNTYLKITCVWQLKKINPNDIKRPYQLS